MNSMLSLIKVSLNNTFGISALKYRFTKEKNKIWEPILIFLSILVGAGSMLFLYIIMLKSLYAAGSQMGQGELVLTLSFLFTQILVLIFGIFYIISIFYFSNDLNILIPLPLKPSQVLAAKFSVVLISEYLIAVPLLLPAQIIYAAETGQDLLYWIKSIILILTAPILPLLICSFFVVLLMRVVNIRKSKDLLVVIGSLVAVFFALGINVVLQRVPEGSEQNFMIELMTGQVDLISFVGNKFPPSLWATYSLSYSGLQGILNLLLILAISISGFLLLMWIGKHIFYKSLLSGQEVTRKKKALTKSQLEEQSSKVTSPVAAIFKREWKLFMRTPIFAMNGLAGMVILPIMLVLPSISNNSELTSLLEALKSGNLSFGIMLGSLAFMLFVAGINIVSCTSLSREGSTFWFSKMIPVSPEVQVKAKLLHGMSISLLGIAITIVVLQVMVSLSIIKLLMLLLLSIIGSLLLNIVNLAVDVIKPKLEWTNPQEAVKQNFNAFLGIILTLVVMGVMAGIAFILKALNLNDSLIYVLLGIAVILLDMLSLNGLYKLAENRYSQFEA